MDTIIKNLNISLRKIVRYANISSHNKTLTIQYMDLHMYAKLYNIMNNYVYKVKKLCKEIGKKVIFIT